MKFLQIIILLLAGFVTQNGSADQTQLSLDHEGVSRPYPFYTPSTPGEFTSQVYPMVDLWPNAWPVMHLKGLPRLRQSLRVATRPCR
jgi:hypothetical protein